MNSETLNEMLQSEDEVRERIRQLMEADSIVIDETIPKGMVKDMKTGKLMRQHVWLRNLARRKH